MAIRHKMTKSSRREAGSSSTRHLAFEARTSMVFGTSTYLPPHHVSCLRSVYIDRHWYVPIRTNGRLGYFDQKTTAAPLAGNTTRARPRPPPAVSGETITVRHIEKTAQPMVDLISSQRVDGSNLRLNLTSRLLRLHGQPYL